MMTPEEMSAVLQQIAEQESAAQHAAEMARQLQRAQDEANKALNRRDDSNGRGAIAITPPERKRDLELLEQERQDEALARSLYESFSGVQMNAGARSVRQDKKRVLEQDAIKHTQLEQTAKDAKLARELQDSINAGVAPAAAPRVHSVAADNKRDVERDAVMARQLQAEWEKPRVVHDTSNDALLAQALAEGASGKEDTSSDAILALELQKQFENKEKSERMTPEIQQDAAIALAMQKAEGSKHMTRSMLQQFENARKNRGMVSGEEWKKLAASLQEILDSNAVVGDPIDASNPSGLTNAHKYTRTLIRAGIPTLFALDKQFKLSEDSLSPEQVLKEVLAFLETLAVAPERVSMDFIKATFARIAKEPALEAGETNANAHHLLSRAWTLAKKWGPAYMGAIATCLSDNIGDAGGCIPGLIARLYAPYARIVGLELGLASKVQRGYQNR